MRYAYLFLLPLVLTACSKDNSDPHGGTSSNGEISLPSSSCDHLVTEATVASFNASQRDFHLATNGMSVHCEESTSMNGHETHKVVDGFLGAEIQPRLRFRSAAAPNVTAIEIHAEILPVTKDDIASIAGRLSIDASELSVANLPAPAYARFGRGALFYVTRLSRTVEDNKPTLVFSLASENEDQALLMRGMQTFQTSREGLELFWQPDQSLLPRQVFPTSEGWSAEGAVNVLASLVREGDNRGSRTRYENAISDVRTWGLDAPTVNAVVPELYTFADGEWSNPSVADPYSLKLVDFLRYLVAVNPGHARAPVLATYDRITRFIPSAATALNTAIDFLGGRTFTANQFNQLVSLSDSLYAGFNNRSWEMANAIAKQNNFDSAKDSFTAGIAGELASRSLLNRYDANFALQKVFAKMQGGLTGANEALYFQAFDLFTASLRASKDDAERAADRLILSGQVNGQNFSLFVDFTQWLINDAYLGFNAAIDVAANFHAYDQTTISLFKDVYQWLTDSAYVNRADAVKKAGTYMGVRDFSRDSFVRMKGYYSWLVDTMYLSRGDALSNSETSLVLSNAQVQSIEEVAAWLVDTVYLSRSDAFPRAVRLVVQANVTPADVDLLKRGLDWLVNTMYVNRGDAATKVEGWVTGANRITAERFNNLKEFTSWLVDTMYLNRADALAKGETLVIKTGFSTEQVGTYKECAEWLVNTAYLSRNDATARSESYITTYRMTRELFKSLQNEFDAQVNAGKNRNDALRLAAQKVLHAN
ncbi:MAG: hypothetical protein ACXWR4_14775 [Bdellovibrionota bacterium]